MRVLLLMRRGLRVLLLLMRVLLLSTRHRVLLLLMLVLLLSTRHRVLWNATTTSTTTGR